MLSLKYAETKPFSSSCPVIFLRHYTEADVLKIVVFEVYDGSHCYFKSLASPMPSCSTNLDRYRRLKEKKNIVILFLLLLGCIFQLLSKAL